MTNVLVDDSYLSDIADSIRAKLGVQDTYKPSEMADAIDDIGGGVTPTGTKQISITENGTTTEDVTNYASAQITVAVPGATLGTKSITENGTYNASSDSLDGYSSVTVNVSGGGGGIRFASGEYTPDQIYESQTVKITDDTTIGFTPTVFILALDNNSDSISTQYAMITTCYYQIGSANDSYRASIRFSNTSGGIQSNVYSKAAWTQDVTSLLKYASGDISFHSSAGYKLVDKKYVWYAFAPA